MQNICKIPQILSRYIRIFRYKLLSLEILSGVKKSDCVQPSRATIEGLIKLKDRQIYKTQSLIH